jgi:DNA-directed RNA polymerase
MLSRLVGRPVSVIRHARLSTKWTNHNLGRRVVMPLPTQHTLLNTHSTATAASHTSEAQSTATAQLPTSFLPASSSDTTPDASNQREILMLQNDEIFIDPRISGIDDQLALMYACLKIGHIERGLHILRTLTDNYRNQKEKFANVDIYNAFIEAYMKQGGQSTRQALYWFDEMRRQKIKPNLTTYAILIKGFARHGPINTARLLLQEMLKEGHELVDLMLNGNLSDVDLKEIKLLSRVNRENKMMISSLHINKLLNSVGKSATKQTETTTTTTKTSVDLSSVPEARSTDVLGVRLLKASLIPLANKEMDLYERQLHLENQAVNASLERLRAVAETRGIEMAFNSYPLRTLMWSWHQKLHPMIAEEQQRVHNHAGRVDTFIYGPFLTLLDAEKLSILTIQQLLRLSTDKDVINGIRTARAVTEVGRAIEMEYYAEQLRERSNTLTKRRCLNLQALYSSGKLFDMHVRKIQARLLEKEEEGNWLARWPEFIRVKLGSLLTSMLMKVAKIKTTHYDKETGKKITEEVDAFYHTYSFKGGHRMGVIRFNDKLVDLFSRDNLRDVLDPRMLPMLVMPRPWVNFESGGYMSRKTLCMRIKNSPEQYHYLKEASMKGHITKVLQGLDVLGSQPWTVNRKVFNAALEAWNSGRFHSVCFYLHHLTYAFR